jgi:hypothetical protein
MTTELTLEEKKNLDLLAKLLSDEKIQKDDMEVLFYYLLLSNNLVPCQKDP